LLTDQKISAAYHDLLIFISQPKSTTNPSHYCAPSMPKHEIQNDARQPVLSLIVTVFNGAIFLERCLASIEAQEMTGIEVVLVDDGSSDNSLSILSSRAARFPGQMHVVHGKNNGVSVARNIGLKRSTGKYVAFVDADDCFEPDYYRRLLALAVQHNLDIAHGNASYLFDDGSRKNFPIYRDDLAPHAVMPGREVLRCRLRSKVLVHMVWMHVYRREFIDSRQARFVPERIHQDVLWTTQAFLDAQRVAYDPTPGYYYRRNHWKKCPDPYDRRPQKVIPSSLQNARHLAEIARGLDGDPELQQLIRWQLVDGALSIFHQLRKIADPGVRRQFYRGLRRSGIFKLLWDNSQNLVQKRRIAKNWLKSLALFDFRNRSRQLAVSPSQLRGN
jgi:heptose III glucuronosyltransferase